MNETNSSTAEQHSSNINVIDDSSNNISSTYYTNHYSDQQPIYNENITSTLPPGSSPCVPNPQQTPLSPFNVNPSQSEILSFDIPGYKIIVIPFPPNSFNMNTSNNNPSQSGILSFDFPGFDIPGFKIIVIPTFSQQDNTYLNYSSSITDTQFNQFQQ
ncbi:hypothetical protein RhiirA1_457196 [Rhizophagus irregularis]|uniref:Uncharacterized protein n=1 Tax=Rhizophagus irregularis TaxID=588596 RepID=A0A2N0RYT1_9GLOM|nr:hypothetical protein RhiirA1_457196 [Rhizophagus irregularis]